MKIYLKTLKKRWENKRFLHCGNNLYRKTEFFSEIMFLRPLSISCGACRTKSKVPARFFVKKQFSMKYCVSGKSRESGLSSQPARACQAAQAMPGPASLPASWPACQAVPAWQSPGSPADRPTPLSVASRPTLRLASARAQSASPAGG